MQSSSTRCAAALTLALAIACLAQGVAAVPACAQDQRLDGFLDIDFGASLAEARSLLLQHEGIALDLAHSNADNLVCDGGTFAGKAVAFWLLGFVDDQMHTARAVIQPDEADLLATYHALVAFFTDKYGPPDTRLAFFDEPYEDGDGFETYAIRFGKGHFAALWKFYQGDSVNLISLSIDENLYIPVVYQSGKLIDLALERHKGAGRSDL